MNSIPGRQADLIYDTSVILQNAEADVLCKLESDEIKAKRTKSKDD